MEKLLLEDSGIFSQEAVELLKSTAFLMPTWKWAVLILSLLIGVFFRPLISLALQNIKKKFRSLNKSTDGLFSFLSQQKIEYPLSWIIIIIFWLEFADALSLSGKLNTYYVNILRGFLAFQLIYFLFYLVDAARETFARLTDEPSSAWNNQLIPFASKATKTLIAVLGILIVLQSPGLNVMSLLAGLGLGGLALALAAQDTAANLFGSITILADQPFKIGDWIKINNNEGTVEDIGFRSTRIRTFYNSVVTIPNAMMAKEIIDNMGVRPLRRIRQVLGLTYETPPEKVEAFCEQVRYLLRQTPQINPTSITVNFTNFNSSSLDVLVVFHVDTPSTEAELQLQQTIFLEIMKVAAKLDVNFAYPTQTTYIKN